MCWAVSPSGSGVIEHGVNEHGVAIGNEAIWTTAPRQRIGLLGMDLLRLGLERGAAARQALDVMTALLEEHGQGGSPRHNNPNAVCYDSSFILADPNEAWVLETSGRDWVARRVQGVYSISNSPCIGSDFELASAPCALAASWTSPVILANTRSTRKPAVEPAVRAVGNCYRSARAASAWRT